MTTDDIPASRNIGVVAKGTEQERAERPTGTTSLAIMALLAIVYTLYLARDFILPLTVALVLKLLLQPVVRLLVMRLRFPYGLAALLLTFAVFGVLCAVLASVSLPASGWIQRAPESIPVLRDKLAFLKGPIDYVTGALHELDGLTSGSAAQAPAPSAGPSAAGAAAGAAQTVALGTLSTATSLFTMLIVLFFLLASGDRLLRGLVEVLPRFSQKREAVEIANEIEQQIGSYLATITFMNALVGIGAGLTMWLCGVGDPLLWGAVAFVLNYVPILGPLTGVVLFLAVGILTFDAPLFALVPAGIYLLIHVAEGEVVTPMLLARRFTLNPVLVILSLFFWHMIWGVPGAFLAVPILAIVKIFCDRIERLKPVGHVIGS